MIHDCVGPLCDMPVDNLGDTCSVQCYYAWFDYYKHELSTLLILQPEVKVPRRKQDQPWYAREVWR